jgi:hypothetical protein
MPQRFCITEPSEDYYNNNSDVGNSNFNSYFKSNNLMNNNENFENISEHEIEE